VSRTRALIEAYALTPEQQREAQERTRNANESQDDSEAALVRALDFLDSCLRPLTETGAGRTHEEAAVTGVATAAAAPPAALEPRHSAWRLPRGLVYWLGVVAAASVTWRMSASLLDAAIAGLLASAAIIILEIVLRMIDPRVARRLGLARGRAGALMYGASAFFGVAAGIAIAYLV
jgi:hypothetical protein